jgi:hypothetical protein
MKCHTVFGVFGVLTALATGANAPATAAGVLDITLKGAYFSEPATVQLTVAVEPNDANRTLRIEAESEGMFRSSEISLNGANEKRLHQIMLKNLRAGQYALRAEVRSSTGVRGVATRELVVIGIEPPPQ